MTCGLSVPPHTVVGTLSPFWVRTAPCSADSLCKEGLLSGCLWCPQSFLERIAFAEAALWGHACAAPDSGVMLFIALLLEHVVSPEARESSRHLAPHCLLLLSLKEAGCWGMLCSLCHVADTGLVMPLLLALHCPSVRCDSEATWWCV